jgi:hypothetical protein
LQSTSHTHRQNGCAARAPPHLHVFRQRRADDLGLRRRKRGGRDDFIQRAHKQVAVAPPLRRRQRGARLGVSGDVAAQLGCG